MEYMHKLNCTKMRFFFLFCLKDQFFFLVIYKRFDFDVESGGNTGKTVAIILGGAAGVGFLVICLLFARNLLKKRDGMYL